MQKRTPTVACDFSEPTFSQACAWLEVSPDQVEVLISANYTTEAFLLKQKYGCSIVLLPEELLVGKFAWGVRTSSALVWCRGLE